MQSPSWSILVLPIVRANVLKLTQISTSGWTWTQEITQTLHFSNLHRTLQFLAPSDPSEYPGWTKNTSNLKELSQLQLVGEESVVEGSRGTCNIRNSTSWQPRNATWVITSSAVSHHRDRADLHLKAVTAEVLWSSMKMDNLLWLALMWLLWLVVD